MARELGIDLHRVGGSGRGGRIDIADLRAYIAQLKKRAEQAATSSGSIGPALPEMPDPAEFGDIESKSLSSIRKTIAGRLSRTWPNLPQVTQFGEADIAELMELKDQHAKAFEKKDAKLTLTAILLKLLPPLLEAHPYLNASLDLENDAVILKKYFHIGLAVDTEQGLLVPVLRDADDKNLLDLARETADVAKAARDSRLDKKAMAGASFTLSNQGGLGGGAFTPLVPYPQAAILGVGRASERPVLVDEALKTHPYLPLALSYDHRLIDGGEAARFMHELVEALEHPDESLFDI
jgi:pyruvate dehydrogenase E2 component (dihydrolipoamide acetyltransferase)